MLNLERLRVLHVVAVTGSVVGAARVLHVTTSAISQQMARLERETGQRLSERVGRGIRLTEAGLLLARSAGVFTLWRASSAPRPAIGATLEALRHQSALRQAAEARPPLPAQR